MKIILPSCLLLAGCAHKPAPLVTMTVVPSITIDETAPYGDCIEDRNVYFFLGKDGAMGVGTNCEKAFKNWNDNPAPKLYAS
jgi:hypothetical protein